VDGNQKRKNETAPWCDSRLGLSGKDIGTHNIKDGRFRKRNFSVPGRWRGVGSWKRGVKVSEPKAYEGVRLRGVNRCPVQIINGKGGRKIAKLDSRKTEKEKLGR